MPNVPRPVAPTVPLADVRQLLDVVEAVLDMPKGTIPDALRYRLAHTSGVLSTVTDARGVRCAMRVLRRVVDAGGAQ
ncbi:hypothetical protein [Nocardiopsis sp. TNDT3]|uniref:hypothetical protein n=1 Tax=Nocardiopsis sp. TNDT3 TaxID=2249354 RepID=UPI000E3E7C56|nr:hypothetical protein [Nocardiopsis sp. TNDT3]